MPRARSRRSRDNARVKYTLELTPEEVALGFDVREHPSGTQIVTMPLASGLRAVKIRLESGAVAYAVCDEKLQPLYANASSLDELKARFRKQ